MKKILDVITNQKIILLIQLIASILLGFFAITLGILPMKYIIILIIVLVLLLLLNAFLTRPSKKVARHVEEGKSVAVRPVIGKILSLLLSIVLLIGTAYIAKGGSAINNIAGNDVETTRFNVYVLANASYEEINDLKGKLIGITPTLDKEQYSTALSELQGQIDFESEEYDDTAKLADDLYDGLVEAIFVNQAYEAVMENNHENFEEETKVIWYYDLEEKKETGNDTDVTSKPFSIYISGIDAKGSVNVKSRSDVNMVVTVNPNTKQILMTSIPRDYYVTLANAGKKDKLTHSGLFGVMNTVESVEGLMDIDIDFYARVNFTSLVDLVDALGGITIYSDKTFKPRHGGGKTIYKGNNDVDGALALGFARERYAYKSGDNHRVQNQQEVLKAILNKMMTPAMLTNYTSILDAISDSFSTNMSADQMKALVNMQLNDGASWDFLSTQLTGSGTMQTGGYMMPNNKLYYMIPNESSVKKNAQYIKDMQDGKTITVD